MLRIILLEDARSDAELIQWRLKKSHPDANIVWVQTRDEYVNALTTIPVDLVIADHSLPGITSDEAFRLLKAAGLDIPFILVTATISEEFAVKMMKEGIADYLLKDRLERLSPAIDNALERWQVERDKQRSIDLLIHNEKRFRAMIENSGDMISVTDDSFLPFFVSSSYSRITGRSIRQGTTHDLDHVHPDDKEEYYRTLNRSKESPGVYFPLQYRLFHKLGHYIWVEGTVINMLSDESINGILFNLRDVTARKEAEVSLNKSQANLTAIIENSNVSIYSIDRQFRLISFNNFLKNSVKNSYGLDLKVGDVIFGFLQLLDPSEIRQWESRYVEAFTGSRVEFEKEFTVGEKYICLSFSINPIIEGHYVTGLSCFAWDITSQKLAERSLRQSEARFRALTENNYDGIVMRDVNRRVVYASPSVKRLLGYSADELADDAINIYVHPDDVSSVKSTYDQMLQQPGVPFPLAMRLKRRNGTYMWSEGVITNMLHNDSVKGVVSNFRDITERKEDEIQREKITHDLVERNKNLEQYAYIVSHNLRGPVANILGISNLLEMIGTSEQDREQSLGHLFQSARRLDEVIKDLNMILQMRQGINEQTEEVDLADLVKDIQSGIHDLIRRNHVEIRMSFAKAPSITTVKSYLHSIFYNLITNSIKYRQESLRPIIDITSEVSGAKTRVTFVDNGIGIDLSMHGEKLFGLYRRFHPGHAEGKGVGLFMTKTQVETLGGTISVKSKVNVGTEVTIEL